jgi:hypothetical protein
MGLGDVDIASTPSALLYASVDSRDSSDFTGFGDGDQPSGQVTFDASGNLHGTATAGEAHNKGVVWEITP